MRLYVTETIQSFINVSLDRVEPAEKIRCARLTHRRSLGELCPAAQYSPVASADALH